MDRQSFQPRFTQDNAPDWLCPTCGKGLLQIKPESFQVKERAHSRDHSYEGWDPEYMEAVYICLLECSNTKCKEIIAHTGTEILDLKHKEDATGYRPVYSPYLCPKYFEPPLQIIKIPSKCPRRVSEPLVESFRLLYSSPSSAANHIRISLENLLTKLRVPRYKQEQTPSTPSIREQIEALPEEHIQLKTKLLKIFKADKRRRPLDLHQRIEQLPNKHEHLKKQLFAIKWLGNEGSHNHDELSIDDVLDAYELMENVLQEIYQPKLEKIEVLLAKMKVRENQGTGDS
jgi:hypothetical protein